MAHTYCTDYFICAAEEVVQINWALTCKVCKGGRSFKFDKDVKACLTRQIIEGKRMQMY